MDDPRIVLRTPRADDALPDSGSEFEDWGERDPESEPVGLERWVIEVDGAIVGTMSAHPIWYGPTRGSRAMNIGIALAPEHRGRGIGRWAQAELARLLHTRGVHRVEASTDIANAAEQRALAAAGFLIEGVARGAQMRADGRHDLQVWSHLA